jgi:hypothetical protein
MFQKLMLFFVLLFPFSYVAAEDDCTRHYPEPVVENKKLVSNYTVSKVKDRILTESFKLKSGQPVKIEQSGCHHFGLSYQFKVKPFPKHETIPTALKLVDPLRKIAPLVSKRVYNALSNVKDKNSAPKSITVTEGYDWVHLSTELKNGEATLVITYDIAL